MRVDFVIEGKPVGKQRPRSNGNHFYTPQKTLNYEEYVKNCYRAVAKGNFFTGGVCASINVLVSVPKSYTKKRREALMHKKACVKPDLDNVAKSILDALNRVAYLDDKQVNQLVVSRYYGQEDKVLVSLSGD